jgi:hypothetical protein
MLEMMTDNDYFFKNLRRITLCQFLNTPAWIAVKILKRSFLNLRRSFVAPNVKKRTFRKKCRPLPLKDPIVSSEPAVLRGAAVVLPIIVPVAINSVTGDACRETGKKME